MDCKFSDYDGSIWELISFLNAGSVVELSPGSFSIKLGVLSLKSSFNVTSDFNRTFVLDLVKTTGYLLRLCPLSYSADKEIVLAAVAKNGFAILLASKELQNDPDVIREAINQNKRVADLLNHQKISAKEILLDAIGNSILFAYFPEEMRENITIFMEALKINGRIFLFASEKLRSNIEIIKLAINNYPEAIWCVMGEWRTNIDLILFAITNSDNIGKYLPYEIYENKSLLQTILNHPSENPEKNKILLKHAVTFQDDRDVVLAAVTSCGCALKWASKEVRNNRDVVLAALKHNATAIKYVSAALKTDRLVLSTALDNKQNRLSLNHIFSMLNIPEFVWELINRNGYEGFTKIYKCKELVKASLPQALLNLLFILV